MENNNSKNLFSNIKKIFEKKRKTTIKKMHDRIKKMEKRKDGTFEKSQLIQRASHGLLNYYILWIDANIGD